MAQKLDDHKKGLWDWAGQEAYITSTTSRITRESRSPSEKKTGPDDPVPNANILKLAENQTKNI